MMNLVLFLEHITKAICIIGNKKTTPRRAAESDQKTGGRIMKKRVVALILCLAMALTLLSTTAFADVTSYFTDTAVVGQAYSETITFSDYGMTSPYCDTKYYDMHDFGMSCTYTGTKAQISGTPTKAGTTICRLIDNNGSTKKVLDIVITIQSGSTSYSFTDTAAVGQEYNEVVYFSDYGMKPPYCDTKYYDMHDYGMSCSYTGTYARIYGTPTKTGTTICRLIDNDSTPNKILDIKITIENGSTSYSFTDTAVVGQEYDEVLYFASYGMTSPYCDTQYYDMQSFGLDCSYTGTYAHIYGTPTKAGATICRLIDDNSTPSRVLDIIITVQPATLKITKQPKSVSAAAGTPVTFSVEATGTGTLSYEWFAEKGSQTSALGKTKELSLTANAAKSYSGWKIYCKVSDSNAAVVSEKAVLTITEGCPFADVFTTDWFYNDVVNANKMGLINGKTATLFKPNDNMTYAEAIKLAACMNQYYYYGQVSLGNGSPNWYDSYVEYARNNGIPWDYKDYNANVSRADYVHIFYYALPQKAYGAINYVTGIPDVGTNHQYFEEIRTFYNAGILTGNDAKGTFNPNSNIKRSEVAAILSRMMDENLRKTFILQ